MFLSLEDRLYTLLERAITAFEKDIELRAQKLKSETIWREQQKP